MAGLRVLLHIDVASGREAEFETLWQEHARYVNTVPGNRGQSLLRRTGQPGGYVVITDWTDEPTFREFEKSEAQQEYLKRLWPMRVSGMMVLTETVHSLPAATVDA